MANPVGACRFPARPSAATDRTGQATGRRSTGWELHLPIQHHAQPGASDFTLRGDGSPGLHATWSGSTGSTRGPHGVGVDACQRQMKRARVTSSRLAFCWWRPTATVETVTSAPEMHPTERLYSRARSRSPTRCCFRTRWRPTCGRRRARAGSCNALRMGASMASRRACDAATVAKIIETFASGCLTTTFVSTHSTWGQRQQRTTSDGAVRDELAADMAAGRKREAASPFAHMLRPRHAYDNECCQWMAVAGESEIGS